LIVDTNKESADGTRKERKKMAETHLPLGGVVVFSPVFRKRVKIEFFSKMMATFPTHSYFLHCRVCNCQYVPASCWH
jgi:hypothetical protein